MRRRQKRILLGLILALAVNWLIYRHAYLTDVVYIYFRNGIATTLDFKTGQQKDEPIEAYCQREKRAIIWLNAENEQGLSSVYLTTAEGKTAFQFDTEQLLEQVGLDYITDLYCTKDERIIFIAGHHALSSYRLYGFCDGVFTPLYDGPVFWSFSIQDEELLFTALSEDDVYASAAHVMALNLSDGRMIPLAEGHNASRLDQSTLILNSGKVCDFEGLVKQNTLTGQEVLLDAPYFDCPGGKINSSDTPIISQNRNYGLLYYFGSVGADSESPMVGLHDFHKNRTINVDLYFRTVLLKKPPQLGWLYPSSHAMNVLLEIS